MFPTANVSLAAFCEHIWAADLLLFNGEPKLERLDKVKKSRKEDDDEEMLENGGPDEEAVPGAYRVNRGAFFGFQTSDLPISKATISLIKVQFSLLFQRQSRFTRGSWPLLVWVSDGAGCGGHFGSDSPIPPVSRNTLSTACLKPRPELLLFNDGVRRQRKDSFTYRSGSRNRPRDSRTARFKRIELGTL